MPFEMHVNFTIKSAESHQSQNFSYASEAYGQIELRQLTEDLRILILHFEDLELIDNNSDEEIDEFVDDSISIMLSNYPVEIEDAK